LAVGSAGLILSIIIFLYNSPFSFSKPMISSPDGYSRLVNGIFASKFPSGNTIYDWLPGNKVILSSAINISPNNNNTLARIESWLAIPLTAIFLSLTVFQLSRNVVVALFAPALLLINPISNYLSLQTLSENNWVLLSSISIFFLCQKKQKLWSVGFLFWSLSQTIRYESWYLTPIIIFVFYFLHRNRKASVIFLLTSIVFPFYWLVSTNIHTGDYFYFWGKKMAIASKGPAHIYHHLVPSFTVWYSQLINLFTPMTLVIFITSSVILIRRNNFLFLLGMTVFFGLVAQVYFGTMEHFPIRYLSLIPFAVISTITVALSYVKYQEMAIFFLSFIFIVESLLLPKRLLSIAERPMDSTIEVSNYLRLNASKTLCNAYIYEAEDQTFSETQIFYFSQIPVEQFHIYDVSQNETSKIRDDCTYILDKGFDNILSPAMKHFLPYKIYENENYIVASTIKK